MSGNIPDIIVDNCDQEMPEEFENFYKECGRLYNRVANYPVCQQQQCKKDSRHWLYKNRNRPTKTVVPDGELVYEQIFSVVGLNGRRFKKDSRVWLHKTSEKAAKLKQFHLLAKQKQLEKNSNCKVTSSFCNAAGMDEDSLTAMSKIAICSDPRCQCVTQCSKRHHETDIQDSGFVGVGCRNRKRRKIGHSVPASPAHYNDSSFAVVSKSLNQDIEFTGCLDKLHGSKFVLESESSESLDLEEHHQRAWKKERSPYRWREFKVVASESSSSHGSSGRETAVSSGGSINLVNGDKHHSGSRPDVPSRHKCVHVQYTPKRMVSVYNIVNEDFYDYFSTPAESPWMNITENNGELDMEEAF